jgi:nitrile hydratase
LDSDPEAVNKKSNTIRKCEICCALDGATDAPSHWAVRQDEDAAMAPDDGHPPEYEHGHDHAAGPDPMTARVQKLEALLVEKGYVDPAAVDALIETYETKVGPRNGARVVAKAWNDPAYRARLLDDATAAIAELGYGGRQGEHMVAVENGDGVHNLVVCTLCSCYPWPVLGVPPTWYKSAAYRSRAVLDPRGILAEFGVALPEETQVRVWDSTAEIRYLVIPERPAGTEGWSEERLADLVTRDSMIGTGRAKRPEEVAA